MTLSQRMNLTIITGVLLAFAPALWADRDDDRGGKSNQQKEMQKDFRKAPPRERETGRVPERHAPPPVHAQPPRPVPAPPARHYNPPSKGVQPPAPPRTKEPVRTPPPPGYVLDQRHHHNHYYPPKGHVVPSLPDKHHIIRHRDITYHYHHGIWYRHSGTRFIVVLPPFGVIVPILPPFYTTIWVGAIPYYYAGGVYYGWYPEYRSYVVVEPPPAAEIREVDTAGSDQLFIYPKLGQSEEQQAKDRYECHHWAVGQTGFDPTQPGGGVSGDQYRDKRADYFRAMKACLEARNYSVQ